MYFEMAEGKNNYMHVSFFKCLFGENTCLGPLLKVFSLIYGFRTSFGSKPIVFSSFFVVVIIPLDKSMSKKFGVHKSCFGDEIRHNLFNNVFNHRLSPCVL